jgi:hypothetical protein
MELEQAFHFTTASYPMAEYQFFNDHAHANEIAFGAVNTAVVFTAVPTVAVDLCTKIFGCPEDKIDGTGVQLIPKILKVLWVFRGLIVLLIQ